MLERLSLFCLSGFLLEEKTSFEILELSFSSGLDRDSYIIPVTKIALKKIGASIHSIKFLSPEVALYLFKSTNNLGLSMSYLVWHMLYVGGCS